MRMAETKSFLKYYSIVIIALINLGTVQASSLVSNLTELVRADTPIGNNPNPQTPPFSDAWYWAAQSFATDANPHILISIEAIVGDGSISPVPDVIAELHADDNGTIGSLLTTLTPPDMGDVPRTRSFIPQSAIVLQPGTAYWFVLGVRQPGDGTFFWSYADSNAYSGPGTLLGFADSTDSGGTWSYGIDFPYLFQISVAAPGPIANTFDGDTEGWLAVEVQNGFVLPITDSTTPGWTNEGNPGGALLIADIFAETFFSAPAFYLGQQCAVFNGHLQFDILIIDTDSIAYPAVILAGAAKTLYYNLLPTPVGVWTTRRIPLSSAGWQVGSWTGPLASDADMLEVLSDLRGLYINAEWHTGYDYTTLDNVALTGPACGDTDHPYPPGDLNQDCLVNLFDLVLLSGIWLQGNCDQSNLWCAGTDFNFDSAVNLDDMAFLAGEWLKGDGPVLPGTCPEVLPVFQVVRSGITAEEASTLAEYLQIPATQLIYDGGQAMYFDPIAHRQLPTVAVVDPDLIQQLTTDTENEWGVPLSFEGLDFDAIRGMPSFDPQLALDLTAAAFTAAGLAPAGAPLVKHTYFEAYDIFDQPVVPEKPINTEVRYQFKLNDIPLIGPGAHVAIAYDAFGNVTQMHYALRELTAGAEYPVISKAEAVQEYRQSFPGQNVNVDARLVYYAPALGDNGAVTTLIPHWDCGGTMVQNGQTVQLLRRRIPAIRDPALVPTIELLLDQDGPEIFVYGTVAGTQSYTQEWSSNAADLSGLGDATQFSFTPQSTSAISRVSVQWRVRNSNGVSASRVGWAALKPLQIDKKLPAEGRGTVNFGCERAVSDLGAANQAGFVNRFRSAGITEAFNLNPPDAWERDFKEGETGLDAYFADNADIVLYIGHGWGGAFTFETGKDDSQLQPDDVYHAWGNWDAEWLALLSCEVLEGDYNGLKWNQRWGPAFDGLHLLLGFETLASDDPDFAGRFADYLLGRSFAGIVTVTLPVRDAWMTAKEEEQPEDRAVVIMGAYGVDNVSNYQDYFWGQGPVGPDLRSENIRGYWRTVFR